MPENLAQFPRTKEYVDRLPLGLESYPECLVVGAAYERIGLRFPSLVGLPGVPMPIQEILAGEACKKWVPETVGNALILFLRDTVFTTDAALLDFFRDEIAIPLFARPIYKALFYVMSPSLAVMGAAKRWGSLRKGSELQPDPIAADGARRYTRLKLTYPPFLFSQDLLLRRLAEMYEFIIKSAGATKTEVTIEQCNDSAADFFLSWQL